MKWSFWGRTYSDETKWLQDRIIVAWALNQATVHDRIFFEKRNILWLAEVHCDCKKATTVRRASWIVYVKFRISLCEKEVRAYCTTFWPPCHLQPTHQSSSITSGLHNLSWLWDQDSMPVKFGQRLQEQYNLFDLASKSVWQMQQDLRPMSLKVLGLRNEWISRLPIICYAVKLSSYVCTSRIFTAKQFVDSSFWDPSSIQANFLNSCTWW